MVTADVTRAVLFKNSLRVAFIGMSGCAAVCGSLDEFR